MVATALVDVRLKLGVAARGVLAACAMTVGLAVPGANAITIEEAVEAAITAHPDVQAAEAAVRAADKTIDDERAGFFPTLDLRAEVGHERSKSAGGAVGLTRKVGELKAGQMLFDGFSTWNRTRAAEKRAQAAQAALVNVRESIALRAAEAYLNVVRQRKAIELAEANVLAHEEVLKNVKFRVESGGGEGADVQQAASREALSKARLADFRGQLRMAEANFLEVVGSMPGALALPPLDMSDMPGGVDEAVELVLAGNPSLMSAGWISQAAERDAKSQTSGFYPSLDLELTANRSQDIGGTRGLSGNYKALLVMNYNLFRGGRDLAQHQRAVERKSEALQDEASTRRLVEEGMRFNFASVETAKERLPLLVARAQASTKVVFGYLDLFELGRRSLLDILDVRNELFQAEVAVLDGNVELSRSIFRVYAIMGKLSEFLDDTPQDAG